jgi:hypothetical protein
MSNETKTCSLTEDEISALILVLAREMDGTNIDETIERMNYLNRRLKAEKKDKPEEQPKDQTEINQASVVEPKVTSGW